MTIFDKINAPVVVIGTSILLVGINIIYRGNIWNIVLGDERYLIGGLALLVGLYITILGLKKARRI